MAWLEIPKLIRKNLSPFRNEPAMLMTVIVAYRTGGSCLFVKRAGVWRFSVFWMAG